MVTTGLLAWIDDIATPLDDVTVMAKVVAKKTAGVFWDDLVRNAEQVSCIRVDRDILVVWAVAKGSFVNKLILILSTLVTSAFILWLIILLMRVGSLYRRFEGVEKVLHALLHS